jgi:hypothetical protein
VQRSTLPKKGGEITNVMEIVYIALGWILIIISVIAALKRYKKTLEGRGMTTIYPTNQSGGSARVVGLEDPSIASSMYNQSVHNAFSHRD